MSMNYKETKMMVKKSEAFYDTINFESFLNKFCLGNFNNRSVTTIIDVDELVDMVDDYFTTKHPELIPPEFHGEFFNYVTNYEFAEYLSKRYGFILREQEVIQTYLIRKAEDEDTTTN